jgi:hypothetical protein
MKVFLASPRTQQQAEHAAGMPVLLSFACCSKWILRGYQEAFSNILIDSGAFSEFSSGQKIDLDAYMDWSKMWIPHADAIAGLDDISGDWRKSLKNYEKFTGGFPTFHETDPPELLKDLIAISQERKQWLGFGLLPPRGNKEKFVRDTLDQIPEGIHVHGWAMRAYTHCRRIDSVDSTHWWRDAQSLKVLKPLSHLSYGECLAIVIKKYQRWNRSIKEYNEQRQTVLFEGLEEC